LKIFAVLDLEGISGVVNFDLQAHPGGLYYDEVRYLATGDLNAAIRGALRAGSADFVIYDTHFYGLNLVLEDLHPAASVILGRPIELGIDDTFDGLFLIGTHCRNSTPGALLCHTFDLKVVSTYLNGQLMGEIGVLAALAGEYDVPLLMLSGDAAVVEEAKAVAPQAEVAVTKMALGYQGAQCLSLSVSREIIADRAEAAVRKASTIRPFKVRSPIELRVEFTGPVQQAVEDLDGVLPLDENTVLIRSESVQQVFRSYSVIVQRLPPGPLRQ
jgi:D-amino peptidase